MKYLRGRKLTKENLNYFSAQTPIHMCSKKLKICLELEPPQIMKNTLDYRPWWVEQRSKVLVTFVNGFGTKCKDGKNVSYHKGEGKYLLKQCSKRCPLTPWHVSNSQR